MSAKPAAPTDHDVLVVYALLADAIGVTSREELESRTGLHERAIREAVAALVVQGNPIVTDRALGGYQLTHDRSKLEAEIGRLKSAASRILLRAQALEAHLA